MDYLNLAPSPLQKVKFFDWEVYIKRDDLINYPLKGNKARKLYYYLSQSFPGIKKLISYGGNQSNTLRALTELALLKKWEFTYYTDSIPKTLKKTPAGNFAFAMVNKALIVELRDNYQEFISNLTSFKDNELIIHQGVRQAEAQIGIKLLAQELITQFSGSFNVFTPSGTGVMALFLQKFLPGNKVYTAPCVGDEAYLTKQFYLLESDPSLHPFIILPKRKYIFGRLNRDLWKIYHKLLRQTGIEFDLIYDTAGVLSIINNYQLFSDKPLIYVHGGNEGNISMAMRYNNALTDKFLV